MDDNKAALDHQEGLRIDGGSKYIREILRQVYRATLRNINIDGILQKIG